jgi:3-deoxy-D-manno-octulosonic-acid transferase
MRGKEDIERITERFASASIARPDGKLIWFHTASVGETMAILSLVNKLLEEPSIRVLVTTFTLSGSKIVAAKFPKEVIHQFLPFDSPVFAKKFLLHWRPDLVIWTESDFWANLITCASRSSKIILLNARISDTSFERWKRLPALLGHILKCFATILPQSDVDYKKLEFFGVKNLDYIGNLKYSFNESNLNQQLIDDVANQIQDRVVVFIASTHPDEERIILERLQAVFVNHRDVLFFLAPRHPARVEEVAALLRELGLTFAQRTQTNQINKATQVYLIDTLGEMNNFYKLSHITIMGGSFVDIGGHNIIEPAKFKNAIICGPFMSNFAQALGEFRSSNAIIQVNAEDLCRHVEQLLDHSAMRLNYGSYAYEVASSYGAVLPKTLQLILSYCV